MADDDLDLGPLDEGPVPTLAPGADVRSRGEQRKRHARAALAGAGLLVVVAMAAAAPLVTGDGAGSETVEPAATPTLETPRPTQSPTASSSATSVPAVTDPRIRAEALPSATELGDGWVRHASSRDAAADEPGLDPCGTGDSPATPRLPYLSGSYQVEDRGERVPESPILFDAVSRYDSTKAAEAAFADYRAAVSACGTKVEGDSTFSLTAFSTSPYVVEEFSVDPAYAFPIYYGVVVVDDLLADWQYFPGERVDREGALQMAALVRTGLCRAAGSC